MFNAVFIHKVAPLKSCVLISMLTTPIRYPFTSSFFLRLPMRDSLIENLFYELDE